MIGTKVGRELSVSKKVDIVQVTVTTFFKIFGLPYVLEL